MLMEYVMLTEQEVNDRFLEAERAAGGQRAWAVRHHLTPAYVNDMVNGRRGLSARVLAMIGVEMEIVITYREITPDITPEG